MSPSGGSSPRHPHLACSADIISLWFKRNRFGSTETEVETVALRTETARYDHSPAWSCCCVCAWSPWMGQEAECPPQESEAAPTLLLLTGSSSHPVTTPASFVPIPQSPALLFLHSEPHLTVE